MGGRGSWEGDPDRAPRSARFSALYAQLEKPVKEAVKRAFCKIMGLAGKRFLRQLSPPPLPFYFALVPISADQTAKNATETLATQETH